MEKLPETPENNLDWYESFEWGPEPPQLWMPNAEEELGEDF